MSATESSQLILLLGGGVLSKLRLRRYHGSGACALLVDAAHGLFGLRSVAVSEGKRVGLGGSRGHGSWQPEGDVTSVSWGSFSVLWTGGWERVWRDELNFCPAPVFPRLRLCLRILCGLRGENRKQNEPMAHATKQIFLQPYIGLISQNRVLM